MPQAEIHAAAITVAVPGAVQEDDLVDRGELGEGRGDLRRDSAVAFGLQHPATEPERRGARLWCAAHPVQRELEIPPTPGRRAAQRTRKGGKIPRACLAGAGSS